MEVKKTQIAPTTPEFGYLEYGLQLALKASTARIVSAFAISNPHLSVQFEKRCKDILVGNTWIDPSQLTGVNTEEDVIRRGWNFGNPNQGMRVGLGVISGWNGGSGASPGSRESKGHRKLILCKVGIGRARVSDAIAAERDPVPEGYDSFYLVDSSENKAAAKTEYHYEYMIKNPAQILPQYIIVYEYDDSKERQSREGADVFGYCRHHPEKLIEFFCSQCHIPVCVFCKMVGNHANGEAAKHQLVSVSEAYQTVLQEAQAHDPILQSRRTEIVNQVASINNRAKAVEKMCGQLESQLEEMYKKALKELRMASREKLEVLKGDELELKRQLCEIEHLEDFLRYQQQGDATQFLFSWARHQHFRAELHDFRFFKSDIDVELDLKIVGSIAVVAESNPAPLIVTSQPPKPKPSSGAPKAALVPHGFVHTPETQLIAGAAGPNRGGMEYPYPGAHHAVAWNVHHAAAASVVNGGREAAGMVGLGLPKKIQERRTQRRTSDFFAETLAMAPAYAWNPGMDGGGELNCYHIVPVVLIAKFHHTNFIEASESHSVYHDNDDDM
ncbi:hypothetical protein HDU96_008099 [Phlyctochytrium bullatum]|nr:hypothetical protein HDU96_008099 [Phlyctochytrium bullatum]